MPVTVYNPKEEGLIEYPDGVSDEEIINHLDSLVNDPYGPSTPPDEDTFRAVAEWLPGFGEYYSVKDLQDWYGNYKKLSQKEAVDPATFAQALPALAGIFIGAGEARSVKEGIQKLFDVTTGKTALRGSNAKARKLLKAQDLESEFLKAGKTKKEANEEIFAQTGWWRDVDGEWRFEIPDTNAKLKKPIGLPGKEWDTAGRAKLGDVLDHPELFNEYPQLKDIQVEFIHEPDSKKLKELHDSLGYKGQYDPRTNTIFSSGKDEASIRDTLLHEVQHAIQEIEGTARGGSGDILAWLKQWFEQDASKVSELKRATKYTGSIDKLTVDTLVDTLKKDKKTLDKMREVAPNQVYWRLKGEMEARNVQIRDQLRAFVNNYDEVVKQQQTRLQERLQEAKQMLDSGEMDQDYYEIYTKWFEKENEKGLFTWNSGLNQRKFTKEQAEEILKMIPTATEDVTRGPVLVVQPQKIDK